MALRIRMYYYLILRTGNSTCNNIGLLADAQRLLEYNIIKEKFNKNVEPQNKDTLHL